MNKDVNVAICSVIKSGQESEKIETVSAGAFFKKEDCAYVLYDEDVSDGIVNKCRIKLFSDRLEMRKTGAYTTIMTFTRDGITHSHYQTPYGALDLEIDTRRFDIIIDKDRIKIILNYVLSSNGMEMSEHDMSIVISDSDA